MNGPALGNSMRSRTPFAARLGITTTPVDILKIARLVLPDGAINGIASRTPFYQHLYRSADRSDKRRIWARGPTGAGQRCRVSVRRYARESARKGARRWSAVEVHVDAVGAPLAAVTRPDGKCVAFRYDAFGRRVEEKIFDRTVTEYIWDGGRPRSRATLAPRRSHPNRSSLGSSRLKTSTVAAKSLSGRQRYSVVVDHIGKPTTVVAGDGQVAWRAAPGNMDEGPMSAEGQGDLCRQPVAVSWSIRGSRNGARLQSISVLRPRGGT